MFLKTALNSDHSIKFRYKIRPLFFSPIDIIDAQDYSTTTFEPDKNETTMNPMTGTTSHNDAVIMMSSCKYHYCTERPLHFHRSSDCSSLIYVH